jgi:CheY-like chemotaxis protein
MKKHDFSAFKVLVAEDNYENFILIKSLLQSTNITLIHASNGVQAVAHCKQNTFNLVLMDAKMPELDGFDATREIKKISPGLPVIMLTAFASQLSIKDAVAAGCNDYLAKPIDSDILYAALNRWLIGNNNI